LIVDDNPTNCRILTVQTGKWGMVPRAAQSAEQALQWLRQGEKFDLAILDMQMPTMDGLMLAAEIRKLPGAVQLPLVLLTSMGVRSDQTDVTNAAFSSCLTKPIKPAQLHEVLIRVISGTTPAKPVQAASKLDPGLSARLPLRVLLCDDNMINQKVAVRLLQQMGYRADLAANGIEALAALDRQPYDFIFMDVMMPEMDGLEATRIIRERQTQKSQFPNYKSPIVIVAMTAAAMQGDRDKCLAIGMDDYLAKPVRPEDIRTILERWGAKAVAVQPEQNNGHAPDTSATLPGGSATDGPGSDEPPVEMERLLDFTDGNPDSLRELVTLYLEQTGRQVEQLEAAIQAGSAPDVRRLAHSCAGASATCGMGRLVPLLRELERQGYEEKLTSAPELCQQAGREFERIRGFLETYLATHADLAAKT
jgi:CheY-like chemotaxis protein/HPt (histidine-containing phosphotransfer) domain-containing protein